MLAKYQPSIGLMSVDRMPVFLSLRKMFVSPMFFDEKSLCLTFFSFIQDLQKKLDDFSFRAKCYKKILSVMDGFS